MSRVRLKKGIMTFLIKMTHRQSKQVVYIGAIQVGVEDSPFEPIQRTIDYETTEFGHRTCVWEAEHVLSRVN